jgi:hypothetical protein
VPRDGGRGLRGLPLRVVGICSASFLAASAARTGSFTNSRLDGVSSWGISVLVYCRAVLCPRRDHASRNGWRRLSKTAHGLNGDIDDRLIVEHHAQKRAWRSPWPSARAGPRDSLHRRKCRARARQSRPLSPCATRPTVVASPFKPVGWRRHLRRHGRPFRRTHRRIAAFLPPASLDEHIDSRRSWPQPPNPREASGDAITASATNVARAAPALGRPESATIECSDAG